MDTRQASTGDMMKSVILGLLGGIVFVASIGALLFGCAGRWDLPMFWATLGVWMASVLIGSLLADPTLAKERMRPGPGGRDYVTLFMVTPLFLGKYVIAGLDVGRFHWSDDVPW